MTIEEIYKEFTSRLRKIYETREAAAITDWVFENVAGIKRLERIIHRQNHLNNSTIQQLNHKLQELLDHKPVQYVLEEAWFYKMKFFVNNTVLIPRPETEELVEWIVAELKSGNEKLKIVDIGTGSGCVAIALKTELPLIDILAIDISAEALSTARQNAVALTADIEFLKIDFLDENEWPQLPSVDIIVSNPPYIPAGEKSTMQENVVGYEPHLALFTGDDDPFIFYKKIALFAKHHLSNSGKIYVEVHEGYAGAVKEIFSEQKLISIVRKDIYGRDRMISARR